MLWWVFPFYGKIKIKVISKKINSKHLLFLLSLLNFYCHVWCCRWLFWTLCLWFYILQMNFYIYFLLLLYPYFVSSRIFFLYTLQQKLWSGNKLFLRKKKHQLVHCHVIDLLLIFNMNTIYDKLPQDTL